MNLQHHLWQEKYRPDSIKKIVMPKAMKDYFLGIIESKKLPHLILHSRNPGSGKSSCAKALCNDLGIDDYKYINASKEANIDTLRTEITHYVSTASISGNHKVVILDDMGANTRAFQDALKVFIEQHSLHTSFILTTNNIGQIIDPIKSRCSIQDFNFSSKQEREEVLRQMIFRFEKLLKNEGVEYEKQAIEDLCDRYYPDIRRVTSILQATATKYGKVLSVADSESDYDVLFDLIRNKRILDARRYIIENGLDFDNIYSALFRKFVPTIEDRDLQNTIIVIIAKYSNFNVMDKELCVTACIIEIIGRLK